MFYLAVIILLASLILGGGTSHGFLSDALLQLVAIPVLVTSLWLASTRQSCFQTNLARFFCLIILFIPLLQLVPLPPEIWTTLPGRDNVFEALKLAFDPLPWMPLSLAPRETWLSFLAMLPPLAVFMTVHQLGYQDRQHLGLVIIVFGILSVFIGLLQLAQGASSPLRFFDITNRVDSVGFFANRNHYAASLYTIIMLVAAWVIALSRQSRKSHNTQDKQDITRFLYLMAGFTVITIFIAGQLMSRSRSGLGLTILALGGIYLMSWRPSKKRTRSGNKYTRFIWIGILLVFLFFSQFALLRMMERFEHGVNEGIRGTLSDMTQKAAWDTMPFGSGLGSYVSVFKQYEVPNTVIHGRSYANHAHNDFLEIWLEAGVPGLFMIGSFVLWYFFQTYQVWRNPVRDSTRIDRLLAKSATFIITLFLLHSLVSYPLRTAANMSLFVFASALLIKPPLKYKKE